MQVIGLGLALGFRITGGFGGFLLGALLVMVFAAAVSWRAVLIGMLAGDAEKVQAFAFTIIFPITFTSSAFVVVDTMPGWLQARSDVNPVTHLSDALRGLPLGGAVAEPVLWSLVWAAGVALVFYPLAMRAYQAKVSGAEGFVGRCRPPRQVTLVSGASPPLAMPRDDCERVRRSASTSGRGGRSPGWAKRLGPG
ncbi:ABC transporter permease [Streptomyces sp. AK010]|uniref:ABC transporter permease n=1 Tax=Streptomyces sp. AK010 TaxID=2723074 RepID=UPI0017F9E44A|nr:ABC transporter permease [Streptomyces sp. AK010]MBB6421359.1 ABC-type polysaccharide/polyol phosphate export permease [Streptomyces sp. AK010]